MPRPLLWTDQRLNETLMRLVPTGPITSTELRRNPEGRRALSAVLSRWDSLRAGLVALGLSDRVPAERRKRRDYGGVRRRWSPEALRAELTKYLDLDGTIHPANVRRHDNALFEACRKWYGGVYAAAEELHIGLVHRPVPWTRDGVLQGIRRRYAEGLDVTSTGVRTADVPLYGAAVRLFGSWGKALTEAGVRARPSVSLAEGDLIHRVQEHRRAGGGPLPPRLASTIRRQYGTVRAFYTVTGLADSWTRDRVVLALSGLPVVFNARTMRRLAPGLYAAALKHFGGWQAACAAAGKVPQAATEEPSDVQRGGPADSHGESAASGESPRARGRIGLADGSSFGGQSLRALPLP